MHKTIARIMLVLLLVGLYLWQTTPPLTPVVASGGEVAKQSMQVAGYTSPAGVYYGKDPSGRFASRVEHVMAHTREDTSKFKHSVFIVTQRDDVIRLIDEAWKKRGPPRKQGKKYLRDVYDIDMERVIGTKGERMIRLIMEADSAQIVTAYPMENYNAASKFR
jgi:hypothetical protein